MIQLLNKETMKLENVAIIGNGGRENSLAWAIQKNDSIKNVFLIPGNGGSECIKKCKTLNLDYKNMDILIGNLLSLDIDLVVIGPETPLAEGLSDILRSNNFLVFGPGADGAKLESSKSWAKRFMKQGKIPTANSWEINSIEEAKRIILSNNKPLVVKADGLASGKGVFIYPTKEETLQITKEILNGRFGEAGKVVVLEEKIEGPEVSIFAISDGIKYILLPSAQDHKRIEEGDKGLNTGGMGAYSPTPLISEKGLQIIKDKIIEPTITELNKRNINYRGVIYFGLMITDNGPKVIEYNCRFGDPECQTIMPLMNKNFVNILHNAAKGNLGSDLEIILKKEVSGCVIATSEGYPLDYKIGYPINLNDSHSEDIQIFHSGTTINEEGELVTNGGRVLSIVCQDDNFDNVFKKIYKFLNKINYKGIFYRKDIGHQVRKDFSIEH
tara:strand:- start:6226 stop:7551 length:1326 start_codon:yes stop_codon:yes gene_type:complete